MANLNTEVWVEVDEENGRFCYTWQTGINRPKMSIYFGIKKCLFRTILADIFRDKIPIEQVHIDQNLMAELIEYKNSHRDKVEKLKASNPTNWNSFSPYNTYSSSVDVIFDSEDE